MSGFAAKEHTVDSIGAGAVRVAQSQSGYRFNLDAVLLAAFVEKIAATNLVELGCGSGIVSFLLAARFPALKRLVAIDCNPQEIARAEESLQLNSWVTPGRFEFRHQDWRETFSAPELFDSLVSNPPWYKNGSGRVNPDPERASSRHEMHGGLREWAAAVARFLRPRGHAYVVYRAERVHDLFTALRACNLEAKRLRFIHGRIGEPAGSVLLELVAGGKAGCRIEPPLIVRAGSEYTPEVARLLHGPGAVGIADANSSGTDLL